MVVYDSAPFNEAELINAVRRRQQEERRQAEHAKTIAQAAKAARDAMKRKR